MSNFKLFKLALNDIIKDMEGSKVLIAPGDMFRVRNFQNGIDLIYFVGKDVNNNLIMFEPYNGTCTTIPNLDAETAKELIKLAAEMPACEYIPKFTYEIQVE